MRTRASNDLNSISLHYFITASVVFTRPCLNTRKKKNREKKTDQDTPQFKKGICNLDHPRPRRRPLHSCVLCLDRTSVGPNAFQYLRAETVDGEAGARAGWYAGSEEFSRVPGCPSFTFFLSNIVSLLIQPPCKPLPPHPPPPHPPLRDSPKRKDTHELLRHAVPSQPVLCVRRACGGHGAVGKHSDALLTPSCPLGQPARACACGSESGGTHMCIGAL